MEKQVTIYCKNTKSYHNYPLGTSLIEIYQDLKIELKYQVVAARVNYKVEDLNFLIQIIQLTIITFRNWVLNTKNGLREKFWNGFCQNHTQAPHIYPHSRRCTQIDKINIFKNETAVAMYGELGKMEWLKLR